MSDEEPRPFDPIQLSKIFKQLQDAFPVEPPDTSGISDRILRRLRKQAQELAEDLPQLIGWVDPVTHHGLLDPSDPKVAAQFLSSQLNEQSRESLAQLPQFWGSGVYAIYYTGQHPAYEVISGTDIPIYIGKSNPKDPQARTPVEQGKKLYTRLRKHAASIRCAEEWAKSDANSDGIPVIRVAEFDVRILVLASTYAGAVEERLIRHVMPVWNSETGICFGIGKHGDRASTRANTRSPWDTLHPGRPWALGDENVPNPRTWREVRDAVIAYTRDRYGSGD
jgi:hypothetical protein